MNNHPILYFITTNGQKLEYVENYIHNLVDIYPMSIQEASLGIAFNNSSEFSQLNPVILSRFFSTIACRKLKKPVLIEVESSIYKLSDLLKTNLISEAKVANNVDIDFFPLIVTSYTICAPDKVPISFYGFSIGTSISKKNNDVSMATHISAKNPDTNPLSSLCTVVPSLSNAISKGCVYDRSTISELYSTYPSLELIFAELETSSKQDIPLGNYSAITKEELENIAGISMVEWKHCNDFDDKTKLETQISQYFVTKLQAPFSSIKWSKFGFFTSYDQNLQKLEKTSNDTQHVTQEITLTPSCTLLPHKDVILLTIRLFLSKHGSYMKKIEQDNGIHTGSSISNLQNINVTHSQDSSTASANSNLLFSSNPSTPKLGAYATSAMSDSTDNNDNADNNGLNYFNRINNSTESEENDDSDDDDDDGLNRYLQSQHSTTTLSTSFDQAQSPPKVYCDAVCFGDSTKYHNLKQQQSCTNQLTWH